MMMDSQSFWSSTASETKPDYTRLRNFSFVSFEFRLYEEKSQEYLIVE